jgi:preprotein translocase subunit SecD
LSSGSRLLSASGRARNLKGAEVGGILAILEDSVVLSTPRIQSAILDGKDLITGSFTRKEAESITARILSGALPVPCAWWKPIPPLHRVEQGERRHRME